MRLIGLSDADTLRLVDQERQKSDEAENPTSEPADMVENMAAPRRKLYRLLKAAIAISMLGTVFVFVRVHFLSEDSVFHFALLRPSTYQIRDIVKLKLSDHTLSFAHSISGQFLKLHLEGDVFKRSPDLDSCMGILGKTDALHARKLELGLDPFVNSLCLKWNDTQLVVNDTRAKGSRCYTVQWTTPHTSTPENCIVMSGSHWYGGSLLAEQQWPLEDNSVQMQPFVSSPLSVFHSSSDAQGQAFGPVLERMWINSAGFGVVADSQEPLHVSVNAHQKSKLCLKSQYTEGSGYLKANKQRPLSLKFTVCMDRTTRHVHEHLVKNFITLPTSMPNEALMQDPVWSTRGINMRNLTEMQAMALNMNITKHSFLYSQFHMAGNVSRTVGSVFFDHQRFPRAHQLIGEMKQDGKTVRTTIVPLLQKGSLDFNEGLKLGVFVNDSQQRPQELQWGGRVVSLVDFTNPSALAWMSQRLNNFKLEAAVRAFHFDSGQAVLVPSSRQTAVALSNPCDYSTHYVRFAHSMGNSSVVAVGYHTQEFPLMIDMGARRSSWGYDLGLKSIIPSVLTLGLLGYPFVMVGPVGGVRVDQLTDLGNRFAIPDRNLYIRWLQLSMFLPGLEMSVGPWEFDEEVEAITHQLQKRRADSIFPLLQTAVKEFLHTGAPVIRPLWWMAGDDEVAQRIDCEFLVSNTLLVAPVLEAGALRRDVYLPRVKDLKWQDDLRGQVYTGGQWLHGYKVGLGEIATFRPVFKTQSVFHLNH